MKMLLVCTVGLIAGLFTACNKDNNTINDEPVFYGQWETSYGDTISFAMKNGQNILTYNFSLNESLPVMVEKEFMYENGHLKLKNASGSGSGFDDLTSFKWNVSGQAFELQGIQWFNFLSSTQTVYTFKKIP